MICAGNSLVYLDVFFFFSARFVEAVNDTIQR